MGVLVRTVTPHNQLTVVRDDLDQIGERGFLWTLYSEQSILRVPVACRNLWLYNGKLLSWHRCEQHAVDQVIRQFGHDYIIPDHPDAASLSHCHSSLKMNVDWLQHFRDYVIQWIEAPPRYIFRVPPPPDMIVTRDQYMFWYRARSLLILGTVTRAPRGHPGGGPSTMSQGLEYLERSHRGEPLPIEEGLRVQDAMRGWLRNIGPPVVLQPYEMPPEENSPPRSSHQPAQPFASQWSSSSHPPATAPTFSPWTSAAHVPPTPGYCPQQPSSQGNDDFSSWGSTYLDSLNFTSLMHMTPTSGDAFLGTLGSHLQPQNFSQPSMVYRPSPVHRQIVQQSSEDIEEAEFARARELMERFPERFQQRGGSSRRDESDPRR